MFSMTTDNIFKMLMLIKIGTMRPTKEADKGYFKIGSEQQIKKGMFDNFHYMKVTITARDKADLIKMNDAEFKPLGYTDKAEYMSEPFNISNPSTARVRYWFDIVPNSINWEKVAELLTAEQFQAVAELWEVEI